MFNFARFISYLLSIFPRFTCINKVQTTIFCHFASLWNFCQAVNANIKQTSSKEVSNLTVFYRHYFKFYLCQKLKLESFQIWLKMGFFWESFFVQKIFSLLKTWNVIRNFSDNPGPNSLTIFCFSTVGRAQVKWNLISSIIDFLNELPGGNLSYLTIFEFLLALFCFSYFFYVL